MPQTSPMNWKIMSMMMITSIIMTMINLKNKKSTNKYMNMKMKMKKMKW